MDFRTDSSGELWQTLGQTGLSTFACIFSGLSIIYLTTSAIYTIYFHPLSHFPGPKRAIISNIFYSTTVVSGNSTKIIKGLHDKYGDVVRWGPNELSFACAEAWKDIYDHRKDSRVLLKDPLFYRTDDTIRANSLVFACDPEWHAKLRKVMSPAFSSRSLLEQEELIQKHANELMDATCEQGAHGPINLVDFFNWTTFDVLGELAFGEPFGSLKNRKTSSWVAIIFDFLKFNTWDLAIWKLPIVPRFQYWLTPSNVRENGIRHALESKDKMLKRAARKPDRKDFSSYVLEKREELGMTDWELAAHANALIVAGSETTATALSGMHYYLLNTPHVYTKLREEIRGRYKTVDEVDARSITNLPYLTACIEEALRIYPPVPVALPRLTPKEGCVIAGHYVPGGTTVGVHMWSVTHNSRHFANPYTFDPERWIDPDCRDNLEASKPFLVGPRMCIAVNMAWIELRIIVAKMTLLYDMEISEKNLDWDRDQSCYTLWQKPDLFVKITPCTSS